MHKNNSLLAGLKTAALPILFITATVAGCASEQKDYSSWQSYKGSDEAIHYSSLKDVDTNNVTQLQVAWEYHTGDADTVNHSQIQCNPIIIDGILYGTTPLLKLFAIDAATGKEKWVFNPADLAGEDKKPLHFILNNNRGVTYWTDGDKDKRIYYTAGSQLFAINTVTGKKVESFGKNGSLDLHDGLGRDDIYNFFITATSPPVIYKNILVTGSRVDEGAQSAPGHIRGYDVRTGVQKWIFHTIPHPGEEGYETWEDKEAYKFIGGVNAWSGLTLDRESGIVYAATGSASYDFFGGKRKGANLFANCLLALDAETGKRKWHFQVLHHDVWDRDLSSPPALVTLKKNGQNIPAVALTTKTGYIYVFERATGKSLFEIKEQAVPTETDLVGEKIYPTQPFPTGPAPFMRQVFNDNDINPYLPDSSIADIKSRLAVAKHDNMYNPITLKGTIIFPGLDGGAEWGGPTYDPETGWLYVNSNEIPWEFFAIDISNKPAANETTGEAGTRLFRNNCMSCHGADRKGSGNFPALIDVNKKYSLASFDTLLQTGRRMMPAFKQLNEKERAAIAAFVLENKKEQPLPYKDTGRKLNDHYKMPYSVKGYNKFLSKEGYPAIAPPWGTISAVDLNTGEYSWKKPLGNDSTVKGSKEPTGIENYGASVVTKGGLLFIAATKDGKFRAFNKRTGALLWEISLPVPAFATPAIYFLNGKQYIVIACGGGKSGLKSGDSYIAFALPG
jgi:quinoprotein glucose dehydrogenase